MFTDVAALPLVLFTFITAARTATSLVIYAISAVTAYVKQWKKTKRSAKNPTPNASSNFSPDPPNAHVSPKLPTLLLITLPGLASDILYYGSLPGIAYVLVPVLADASSLLLAITSRSDSDEDSTDGDDENDGNDEYAALPAAAATHAPPPGSPKPARPPRTRRERASLFLSAASLLFATLPAISLVTAPTPSLKYQSLTTAVFLFAQLLRWFAETTTQTLLRAHNAPIHPPRLSLTRNLITLLSLAALSPLLLTVQSWLLRPTTQAADLAFYEPGEILERFEDVKQCIMGTPFATPSLPSFLAPYCHHVKYFAIGGLLVILIVPRLIAVIIQSSYSLQLLFPSPQQQYAARFVNRSNTITLLVSAAALAFTELWMGGGYPEATHACHCAAVVCAVVGREARDGGEVVGFETEEVEAEEEEEEETED